MIKYGWSNELQKEVISFQAEFRGNTETRLAGFKNKTVSRFQPLQTAKGSHSKK